MNVLHAVILGIIQGVAEFLPISSSGHLVLLQQFFGIKEDTLALDIILHLGTLVPVFIVFRKDILAIIKKPFQKMTGLIIVGTIPAVVVALLFKDTIESLFATGGFLSIGFFITGVLLLYSDNVLKGRKKDNEITYVDAVVVGIMQGVAIAPGISRSGATITGSLGRKLTRETAAKFSFLLSVPAILGGAVLTFKDILSAGPEAFSLPVLPLVMGFAAAALSGYLSIKFLLKIITNQKLKYFSYYVFALGAVLLIYQFVF